MTPFPANSMDNADWNDALEALAQAPPGTDIAAGVLALTPASDDWNCMLHHEVALALYQRDPDTVRALIVSRLRASTRMLKALHGAASQNDDAVVIDFLNYRLLYHLPSVLRQTQYDDPNIRSQAQAFWDWANAAVIAYYTTLYSQSPERFAFQIARMASCERRGNWALRDAGSPSPAVQYVLHAHPEAICASVDAMNMLFNAPRKLTRDWALKLLRESSSDTVIYALLTPLADLARRERFKTRRKQALMPLQVLAGRATAHGTDALKTLLVLSSEADSLGTLAMVAYVRARHARENTS
jgi:hypothetical protein